VITQSRPRTPGGIMKARERALNGSQLCPIG
jgi:hypothetical protein